MTDSLKILGQLVPTANVLTDIYTVPPGTFTAVSSITACNQNSSSDVLLRISIALGGAADDPKQYLYYDLPLEFSDTFVATIGVSLGSGDVVRVRSSDDNISFQIFGVEVT